MIFTVGNKEEYEAYIDEDENPIKEEGGSVWRFWKDANDYLEKNGQQEFFGIYAVDADWYTDAISTGFEWRELKRDAKMVRVRR